MDWFFLLCWTTANIFFSFSTFYSLCFNLDKFVCQSLKVIVNNCVLREFGRRRCITNSIHWLHTTYLHNVRHPPTQPSPSRDSPWVRVRLNETWLIVVVVSVSNLTSLSAFPSLSPSISHPLPLSLSLPFPPRSTQTHTHTTKQGKILFWAFTPEVGSGLD